MRKVKLDDRAIAIGGYKNRNLPVYQPDIVVVNLFQNDSWIVNQPANEQFKARFGTTKPSEEVIVKAYAAFGLMRSKISGMICGNQLTIIPIPLFAVQWYCALKCLAVMAPYAL